jgi:hypothetical protein
MKFKDLKPNQKKAIVDRLFSITNGFHDIASVENDYPEIMGTYGLNEKELTKLEIKLSKLFIN